MRAFVFSWLGGGNLNNGANAGLWYVNGNNGLGNANWNIGSRQSGAYGKLSLFTSRLPHARRRAMRHASSTERNSLKTTGLVAIRREHSAGDQRGETVS